MLKSKELDQFYTNPKVSDSLFKLLKTIDGIKFKKILEPSAGSGNFTDTFKKNKIKESNILAYDIDPKREGIRKANFLEVEPKFNKDLITIGNPPFGYKGSLAVKFINKSSEWGNTVAMILPRTMNRWTAQKNINQDLSLIYSSEVEDEAFILNDKRYDVKTVFQIWTKDKTLIKKHKNLRILVKPDNTHPDFKLMIHNNTKETLKYFNKKEYKWNIAIHRQGYYDYSKLIKSESSLIKKRQYLFVKFISNDSKKIINKMDFKKLSLSNTQTPGFSNTDFVKEYKILKGETNE